MLIVSLEVDHHPVTHQSLSNLIQSRQIEDEKYLSGCQGKKQKIHEMAISMLSYIMFYRGVKDRCLVSTVLSNIVQRLTEKKRYRDT